MNTPQTTGPGPRGAPAGLFQVTEIWSAFDDARRDGTFNKRFDAVRPNNRWPVYTKPGNTESSVRIPLHLLIKDQSLGPVLRLILIRVFCQDRSINDFIAEYARVAGDVLNLDKARTSYLPWLLNPGALNSEGKALEPHGTRAKDHEDILLHMINSERTRINPDAQHFKTGEVVFRGDFIGSLAPQRFIEFLESEFDPSQPLSSQRQFIQDDARAVFKQNIVNKLLHGNTQLINVHSAGSGMANGLTAFAEAVATDVAARDPRPVIYLPLRRRAAIVGLSKSPCPGVLGVDHVLGYLDYFTEHGSTIGIENAKPLDPDIGIHACLARIRQRLVNRAYIFIIDGFHRESTIGTSDPARTVRLIVEDNHNSYILSRLLEPMVSSLDPDDDTFQRFTRNRFLVLSDIELSHVNGVAKLPGADKNLAEPFPMPTESIEDEVLFENATRGEQVKSLLNTTALFGAERRDSLYLLLDATLGILIAVLDRQRRKKVNATTENVFGFKSQTKTDSTIDDAVTNDATELLASWLSTSKRNNDPKLQILTQLCSYLREHMPIWYETLLCVAAAPEGCRARTLQRMATLARRLPDRTIDPTKPTMLRPLKAIIDACDSGNLLLELSALATAGGKLIDFLRDESVEGLLDTERALDSDEPPLLVDMSGKVSVDHGWTLDFCIPEARGLLHVIAATDHSFNLRSVYLLLSEISLEQQQSVARHAGLHRYHSVRSFQRLIGAIYYGLLSLEISVVDDLPVIRDVTYGPDWLGEAFTSRELHRFLYVDCYRTMLEQVGNWRLNSKLGLADVKLSILQLVDRPFLLERETMHRSIDSGAPGLFGRNHDHVADRNLSADFFFGLTEAHLTRGETTLARAQLQFFTAKQNRKYEPVQRAEIREIKREIDVELQACLPIDEVRLIFEPISTLIGSDICKSIRACVENYSHELSASIHNREIDTPSEDLMETLAASAASAIEGLCGEPARLSDVIDLLLRVSQYDANRADFSSTIFDRPSSALATSPDYAPKINELFKVPLNLRNQVFCRSYAWFLFVEELRRAFRRQNPDADPIPMSALPTRVAIRVALRLDRKQRRAFDWSGKRTPFEISARQWVNRLATQVHGSRREQAELLILDSVLARGWARIDNPAYHLKRARHYLATAELQLVPTNQVGRSRLRLSLERSSLHLQLCKYHTMLGSKNRIAARQYLSLSLYDRSVFERIVSGRDCLYWKLLAFRQKRRIRSVSLQHHPDLLEAFEAGHPIRDE